MTTNRTRPRSRNAIWAKRLVDHHVMPPGTVLIDRVFDRKLGRIEDPDDEPRIEGNFYLDPEEEPPPSRGVREAAMTAVVGATFEAAASTDQRRKLRHGQAMCVIVLVPTPAWAEPVSLYYQTVFGDRWIQRVNYGADQTEPQNRAGSTAVSLALAGGQSVVGISADVSLLPRTILGAADLVVRLSLPNAAVLKVAIARFAGRAPVELDDTTLARLDLNDIVASFRPGTGPQRIAQRLAAAAAALRMDREL